MVHLLVFEFEDTLVDERGRLFPFAVEALATIKNFETGAGRKPDMCVVTAQVSGALDAGAVVDQLLGQLDTAGLKSFFEPVSQKITTSRNAGSQGIDSNCLEVAISRSCSGSTPDQCIFLTGDRRATIAAKNLGIRVLLFDRSGAPGADFADWSEAPLLVAKTLNSGYIRNVEAALRLYLKTKSNMDLISLTGSRESDTFLGKVNTWQPIRDEGLGELSGVNVKLPAEVTVQLDASGKVKHVDSARPSTADEQEAKHFLESLVNHGQIAPEAAPSSRGATHQIETDSEGRRYLVRKRFTAV